MDGNFQVAISERNILFPETFGHPDFIYKITEQTLSL